MTPVIFEEKYYPAVKETVYQTRLSNGLTVSLLPKKQFNEVYGVVTVQFGSVDTSFTLSEKGLQCYQLELHIFLNINCLREKMLRILWSLLHAWELIAMLLQVLQRRVICFQQ